MYIDIGEAKEKLYNIQNGNVQCNFAAVTASRVPRKSATSWPDTCLAKIDLTRELSGFLSLKNSLRRIVFILINLIIEVITLLVQFT